ncbi:MAG: peptidoglycan bridge formation glycyltransferase FemA/FemB family protein [Patescibacteria group bacterium]|jgi:lipid II:glycine glycyltransferase (peptidoglycan interpeptide bridge formation enzyme)
MATIFQTKEWEQFKLKTGWQKSWRIFNILILEKKIPLLGSMLYTPMLSRDQTKLATEKIFLDEIRKIAKDRNAVFFRMESNEAADGDIDPTKSGYRKAFEEMQPEHTLILDLTKSEEDILKQMKQKGRYNIKIAERYEIQIDDCTITDFHRLYAEMAKRHKITYRKLTYFENLIDSFKNTDYVKVFGAKTKDGNLLASAVIVYYKNTAIYLFGGSSDVEREKMATYKLHWEIIKEAKKCGLKYYDFFGISPEGDEKHSWAGVSRFKRQFGGADFTSLGSWDMGFSPFKYQIFKMAEKIRRK